MNKSNFFKYLAWGTIAVCFVVFCLAVFWVFDSIASAEPSVKAASITALVTVSIYSFGRLAERVKDVRQRVSAEKIPVYMMFFDFYFDLINYQKLHGKAKSQDQILSELATLQKNLVFWGSDGVVRAFLNFQNEMQKFDGQFESDENVQAAKVAKMMSSVALVLKEMRKDIGYSFTTFSTRDLARLQLASDEQTQKIFEHLP